MNLFLVHHADAVGPDVDARCPLSARGRAQAEWLAAEAKAQGVAPSAIWHSGKLRARETAEAFLVRCSPFATFQMVRGLSPEDPVGWMADAIRAEDADIMVVGHIPHLPTLALRLSPATGMFPLHGLVWMVRTGDGGYEERLRLQPALD